FHVVLKTWLRLHALLGYLRDGCFLGFVSATSVLPLLDRCETVRFPPARTIQAAGLSTDRWFVVRSGEVLFHPSPDEPFRRPRLLGPGDCFGERALLGQGVLPLAESLTDVECLALRRDAFSERVQGAPSVVQTHVAQLPAAQSFAWVGQREASDCGVAA